MAWSNQLWKIKLLKNYDCKIRDRFRYAMTGYGVGFPKGSKWIPAFNEHLMRYRQVRSTI